jgi:DNA protecting protein DprA
MTYDWERQQPYAYWLECVKGLGRKSRRMLVEAAGSPQAAYEMTGEEWRTLLTEKKAEALEREREACSAEGAEERYRRLCERGIRYIPHMHPDYPKRLKKIPDPPFGIFLLGSLPGEQKPAVAIIGARECSEYGRYMAERAAAELSARGISVISGMARGIDGISQRAALRAGGSTYAVLGCGVDICYPPENRGLYEELKTSGGILSEYLPGTRPQSGLFPMRNRIISGLSDLVLIVEAREKSGTLITADMALEQGKEVYVVPGRITDPLSSGCNRLIRQGAGIAVSIEEMLEETGILRESAGTDDGGKSGSGERPKRQEAETEREGVLRYLDFYPKGVEQLQKESGMEYRQMLCELMELCMENKAEQVSAGQYLKRRETKQP